MINTSIASKYRQGKKLLGNNLTKSLTAQYAIMQFHTVVYDP